MIRKSIIGIKRHPKRFVLALVFGYCALWTFLEPLFAILEVNTTGYHAWYLGGYGIISLIAALVYNYPKNSVSFGLKNTNTKVEITFGDLFETIGHKVISVSEYHDTEIGLPVSPRSLQGIFIQRILGGHTDVIDKAVNDQLGGQEIEKVKREKGKKYRFSIGSTISVPHNNSLYFLFALSKTDLQCNAYSAPSIMLEALDGLWKKVRLEGNGEDINLPLIGDGLSRIGLPKSQLIQLVLISLLNSVKERDLSSRVRIVLLEDTFEKVDLELIKNNWQ